MLIRIVPIAATVALCAATAHEIMSPPTPRLLYNKSESAPQGWYRIYPDGDIKRDSLVAAFAPAQARKLADIRGYLPANIPLIKTVWAIGGDRVCYNNGVITAPNRPDIHALTQDGLGREMPVIEGCLLLGKNEVFLISTDVQTSWDSRYFGAIPISNILGTVRHLEKQRDGSASSGAGHGF